MRIQNILYIRDWEFLFEKEEMMQKLLNVRINFKIIYSGSHKKAKKLVKIVLYCNYYVCDIHMNPGLI